MNALISLVRMWLTRTKRPFYFSNTYEADLNYKHTEKLGLYVHIPFCRSLCAFCPYCKVIYDKELVSQYVEALLQEIEMVGKMQAREQKSKDLKGQNPKGSKAAYDTFAKKKVTSLYFGGGTPALLADDIERIIHKIKEYFVIQEGIGLELHPLDVTVPKLLKLKAAGITKISIGIQSFQTRFLELLGRKEMDYDVMFRALQEVSFETVSMDFIFALPGQTAKMLEKDIETAFSNHANHVALYPFIDFTYTSHSFRKIRNTDKKNLLYEIVAYMEQKGYVRDSIWTFSKDGQANYSSMTRVNFLGFGCSATTLLKNRFKINTFGVEEYIARIKDEKLPTALTLRYTLRQRMVYYLFWSFYSMEVHAEEFEEFFSKSLGRAYGLELFFARIAGLLTKEGQTYRMTTKGSYYYHYFENYYTLSYIDQMWSVMRKDPFPEKLIIK